MNICPNRDCNAKDEYIHHCYHYELHEKNLTCDIHFSLCPSCVKELEEFIAEKEMEI